MVSALVGRIQGAQSKAHCLAVKKLKRPSLRILLTGQNRINRNQPEEDEWKKVLDVEWVKGREMRDTVH